ncbi:MAG: hypothetical protein COU98_01855 [Candidatus Staskawiczbacteria bacterium CG10_big_fil_rev_8_21_14_0_10_38_10]|uniref:Uncharacterized protein n=1 Tax=Candidatus Staskawiczbacteria bacterium CG10_big_fil_rev_8_21_14_0_10_38_10 TaxID=1974891 RepID=A0A2H9T155_9BACT|nr:MAG: hypothetical protein COU98_01855 [Candidatus Staskawiczbacteria bacterium CG10_big_fil_rev_8_21_14_0_10_38_10]
MIEVAPKQNIISLWFFWYFYEMSGRLIKIWKNFLLFNLEYFSIPALLKTLFSPWRRYIWMYPRGFDVWGYLETSLSNLISRFLGALCRICLIITGIIFEAFVFVLGLIILITWLIWPVLLLMGLLTGFNVL